MGKGTLILKTKLKGLIGILTKKFLAVLVMVIVCLIGDKLKNYVAGKFNINGSIFKADIMGTISMILIYIVLGILLILLLIALFRFLIVFYELKRTTTIDFDRERIIVQSYEFPFSKEVLEKKFNRIVGIEISQNLFDRPSKTGNLYVEYLVQSKNDSKLRGMEIPYVLNPSNVKDRLMEEY